MILTPHTAGVTVDAHQLRVVRQINGWRSQADGVESDSESGRLAGFAARYAGLVGKSIDAG